MTPLSPLCVPCTRIENRWCHGLPKSPMKDHYERIQPKYIHFIGYCWKLPMINQAELTGQSKVYNTPTCKNFQVFVGEKKQLSKCGVFIVLHFYDFYSWSKPLNLLCKLIASWIEIIKHEGNKFCCIFSKYVSKYDRICILVVDGYTYVYLVLDCRIQQ